MANLNIIGNGFDLYHGLPTSYYYFACYFLENYEEVYDSFAEIYGFSKGIGSYQDELIRGIDDIGFWREFEKSLGNIAPSWAEYTLVDDLNLEFPDPPLVQEIDKPNVARDIQEILYNWMKDTIEKESVYNIVNKMIGSNKILFNKDDDFISFNYTQTLEQIYGVESVCYLHGKFDKSFELILGHGNEKDISKLGEEISRLEYSATYNQADCNRRQEYMAEKKVLEETLKPVGSCIRDLVYYIDSCDKPNLINVYGLSFGDVDLSYLKRIHEKWPDVNWRISFYSKKDKDWIEKQLLNIGFLAGRYSFFKLKNPIDTVIRDEIIKKENIKTYPTIKELDDKRPRPVYPPFSVTMPKVR